MPDRLTGKVAIITGASRGVGLADAQLFAAEGATVILTDINQETGEKEAAAIGEQAQFFKHDVCSESDWKALIEMVESQHGRLDILVNNAAILQYGEINTETLEGFKRVQAINSESVFLGMQNSLPLMEKSGGGSIINMSSSAAIFGMPLFVAYSASKSAVRGMTKAVAVHCHAAGNNIRCNSIHPDGIATDMVMEVTSTLPEDSIDASKAMQAASYMCLPQDVAKTVLFLASDDSANMNGAEIRLDKSASITAPYF